MRHPDSITTSHSPGREFGLSARLIVLGVVLFAEKVLLNFFIDFDRAQSAIGLGAWLREGQHWGFRFLVAMASVTLVLAYVRRAEQLKLVDASVRPALLNYGWLLTHILCVTCLIPLAYSLFRDSPAVPLQFPALATLLVIFGTAAAASAVLMLAPWSLWLLAIRAVGIIWGYAAVAAVVGAGAMQLSQQLWTPTAEVTFDLVRRILSPILPTLHADAATRILSTDRFAVEVSDVCSGLEGVGLILAFIAAWLVVFRREYIFPRALILIPVGIATIFALNVFRIAALMLVGNAGFPDVAQYGFHSQAGWIAFNTAACGLVYVSRRSAWLCRSPVALSAGGAIYNPTAAYLMPLLAILAGGVLSHALSGRFETLYPIRLLTGAAALWMYRREVLAMPWKWTWRGPAVGALIFLMWIVAARFFSPAADMPTQLAEMHTPARAIWLLCRVAAAVVTVPIAEELAYRGFLMRRLVDADFQAVPFERVPWRAIVASAIVFGLAHGVFWIPGIAAGLAFGLLAQRQRGLGDAVSAHAVANALLAVSVLAFGQWTLW